MDRSYFMRQVMAGHRSEIGYSCWLGFIVREHGHGGLQGENVQKCGLGESVPYLDVELCHNYDVIMSSSVLCFIH